MRSWGGSSHFRQECTICARASREGGSGHQSHKVDDRAGTGRPPSHRRRKRPRIPSLPQSKKPSATRARKRLTQILMHRGSTPVAHSSNTAFAATTLPGAPRERLRSFMALQELRLRRLSSATNQSIPPISSFGKNLESSCTARSFQAALSFLCTMEPQRLVLSMATASPTLPTIESTAFLGSMPSIATGGFLQALDQADSMTYLCAQSPAKR